MIYYWVYTRLALPYGSTASTEAFSLAFTWKHLTISWQGVLPFFFRGASIWVIMFFSFIFWGYFPFCRAYQSRRGQGAVSRRDARHRNPKKLRFWWEKRRGGFCFQARLLHSNPRPLQYDPHMCKHCFHGSKVEANKDLNTVEAF